MPAKWQQWMPLHIDKWRGSPAVKAMQPAARSGYLDLLLSQWQSEDCTISADPMDLADASGLGDELWAVHSGRILKNFVSAPKGRLRNLICYSEWQEAKRVFESRKESARKTNVFRATHGDRSVTDAIPSRSADTITGTVTITEKTKTTARGTRLPSDFLPSESHQAIADERHLDLARELESFRDHFTAAPGQLGVKLDWDATLRNWLRRSRNIIPNGNGYKPKLIIRNASTGEVIQPRKASELFDR